jgi:hypothetical protein
MASRSESKFSHLFGHRRSEKLRAYKTISENDKAEFRKADAHNDVRTLHVDFKQMKKNKK